MISRHNQAYVLLYLQGALHYTNTSCLSVQDVVVFILNVTQHFKQFFSILCSMFYMISNHLNKPFGYGFKWFSIDT